MFDEIMRDITIYHKNGTSYDRYVVQASYRETADLVHDKNEMEAGNSATIRIFDIDGYNSSWFVDYDDVIVNKEVEDDIAENAPLSQLRKTYGNKNVFRVMSITESIYNDEDMTDLYHIKLGCK